MRTVSLIVVLVNGTAACTALAQDRSADEVRSLVEEAVVSIETAFDCDLAVSGTPMFRPFWSKWEIAFFAAGEDCDAASAELQRRVEALEIQPYRRPNLAQVNVIIRRILTSVRSSGCNVVLRGEPSFDERSGQWSQPYRASGSGCDDVGAFLRDVGVEQQISFWPIVSRQDLIR